MATITSTGALDTVQQQIRRVRRLKHLYELQRTVFVMIATVAAAATLLLPLALFAPQRLFAVAAWSTGAAVAATLLLLGREAQQRWLGADAAVAWIERRGDLRGRLRTLVEVERRRGGSAFFLPLLLA